MSQITERLAESVKCHREAIEDWFRDPEVIADFEKWKSGEGRELVQRLSETEK